MAQLDGRLARAGISEAHHFDPIQPLERLDETIQIRGLELSTQLQVVDDRVGDLQLAPVLTVEFVDGFSEGLAPEKQVAIDPCEPTLELLQLDPARFHLEVRETVL